MNVTSTTISNTTQIIHGIMQTITNPIVTFILGFLISYFTMPKVARVAHKRELSKVSTQLGEGLGERFQKFQRALNSYNNKANVDATDFFEISTAGQIYFDYMKIICDAILSKNIGPDSAINTHFPNIKDAAKNTLPLFYKILQEIAQKNNFTFNGRLRKDHYQSIINVLKKYLDDSEVESIIGNWDDN